MSHFLSNNNKKNIKLLLYALIIGLVVGLLGTLFRITLNYIEHIREYIFENAVNQGFINWIWPVLFAITGVSISLFLVRKFAPETSGSGVQEIEGALDGKRPMRWKRVLPVKFIASLFSLGSGLLLGREGPTIQLGANIGHMIKNILGGHADIENNPLVSAGAAGGLACAFNAPFAGIIFVIEEMHEHFKFNFYSVAAIMIGAGTSDFVVRTFVGASPVIQMTVFQSPDVSNSWLFIILGLLLSILGYTFNKLLILSLNTFNFISKIPVINIGIFAGTIIALIGIFYPEMIGGGYETISQVLDNSFSLSFLLILFSARMLLSIFSYTTGVSGGIFVPWYLCVLL